METTNTNQMNWNFLKRLLFRFFFVYFILYASSLNFWFDDIGFISNWIEYYNQLLDWLVKMANSKFFKVYKEVVQDGGSSDTAWDWTQLWMFTTISIIVAVVWTGIAHKKNVSRKQFWFLVTTLRYFLAVHAFGYGIIKVFDYQMSAPNLSQLATPLGDFSPMRITWMFLGYSSPYQVFSGAMEMLVGCLLFFRRTTTAGVLIGLAVFVNVVLMNYSYDIVVKLLSTHIVVMFLFLMIMDYRRILAFFVLNKPTETTTMYEPVYGTKWYKMIRIVIKLFLVVFIIILPIKDAKKSYDQEKALKATTPIKIGYYDVIKFAINKDTIASKFGDSARWENVVFDLRGLGSMISADTLFWKRYGRSYFSYATDSAKQELVFKKYWWDTTSIFKMHYFQPDSLTVLLKGKIREDSIFVHLRKNTKDYRLRKRSFNWRHDNVP